MTTFIRFPVEGTSSVLVNVDAIAYAIPGEANGTRLVMRMTQSEDKLDVSLPFATVASLLNAQNPPA